MKWFVKWDSFENAYYKIYKIDSSDKWFWIDEVGSYEDVWGVANDGSAWCVFV